MDITQKFNNVCQALSIAMFGTPPQDTVAGSEQPAGGGGLEQRLSSVYHFQIPEKKEAPDGFVYIENNCLKAKADLSDYERDRLELEELILEASEEYLRIADLKARMADRMAMFRDKYTQRNTKRSQEGKQSSMTVFTLDRRGSLTEKFADKVALDDMLMENAKGLIDACFKDWGKGSRNEMEQAVEIAFRRDSNQKYSRQKVVELTQIESDDPRWNEAMRTIRKAETVVGVASYYAVEIQDKDGRYHRLPLDIAAARPYRKPPPKVETREPDEESADPPGR